MFPSFDDRVTIYLAIESVDLVPSVVTDRLGMRPDKQWAVGDVRGRTGNVWNHYGWVVETTVRSEDNGGRSASELIPIAIENFENKFGRIAKGVSSLGDSAKRYVVLVIIAEYVPGIELSNSFLRLLTNFGGTFQIDLSTQLPVSSSGCPTRATSQLFAGWSRMLGVAGGPAFPTTKLDSRAAGWWTNRAAAGSPA